MGNGLNRLKDVVEAAERQYPRREWQTHAHHFDEREIIWGQVTGDFYKTLQECEDLVARHGRNGRTRAFANLNWGFSTESQVDNLLAKIKFHITKVEYYATPSKFEILIRHGRDLQQLRRQVANLERRIVHGDGPPMTLWAHVIPAELKAELERQFNTNRPSWLTEGSGWSLKEGLEALFFHFAKGTVNFNPTPTLGNVPDIQQFLSLAKAIWILERVKESQHFKTSSTESIWADDMRELEDDLRGQLHRFETGELVIPPAEGMLGLPSDLYTFTKGNSTDPDRPDAVAAGPLGEQLLQLDLLPDSSNSESSLFVLRESDFDFSFVVSTTQTDALGAPRLSEVEISMDKHRLVPIYASPTQTRPPRNSMMIFNDRGERAREYAFHEPADVRTLQRALTGYRVHHDMPLSSWRLNGSEQTTHLRGGTLQLWQYKALQPMSALTPSKASNTASSTESPRSPVPSQSSASSADLMSAQLQHSRRSSVFSNRAGNGNIIENRSGLPLSNVSNTRDKPKANSLETRRRSSTMSSTIQNSNSSILSHVQGPRNNGIQALKPEPPVLVIFTMYEEKYSFLHLTRQSQYTDCMTLYADEISVDENIYVNSKACGCRSPKLQCDRVIFESKKRNFTIRTLSADQGLGSWDLSVFRFPRSGKFQKAVKNDKVKTLELKFAGADGKLKKLGRSLLEAKLMWHRKGFVPRRIHVASQL